MTSGTKQQRDPVTLLTVCVLWLAMGVFVLYPIVRLLAMTFIVDGHLTFENLTLEPKSSASANSATPAY